MTTETIPQVRIAPPRGGCEAGQTGSLAVPLFIHGATAGSSPQPLTVGIPFPRGGLQDTGSLCLVGDAGRPIRVQSEALAHWPDGSVKWLLLDFVCPGGGPAVGRWTLCREARAGLVGATPLRVEESARGLVIDTGAAVFHLRRDALPPFHRVLRGGRDVLDLASVRTFLTDTRGRVGRPRVERFALETRGPVRATVRLEGVFRGRVPCRFVARCCFFAGTGLVRLRLTVHNPNRARHRGGLWDLGDPGSMLLGDLSLELGLAAGPRVTWQAEPDQPSRSATSLEIYQDSSGGANWQSRNHVNREGRVPCSFRGYRVRSPGGEARGLRASPVVAVQGAGHGVAAAVPEFWQQFPKAIEAEDGVLRLRLFPGQFGDPFELQGGEQKTHTVWLHFGDAEAAPLAALDWVHRPARVTADPGWYSASGALPYLLPTREAPDARLDALLREALEGPNSLAGRREVIDEYGWRPYGEIYADHEAAYYQGPPPVVSHYNNQYDLVYGAALHYFRSGDPRWFELLDPLARHIIDIDIYHTTQDRAAYNGGLFWHTDHYRDAATCTHRGYSAANRPQGRLYGGGPCNEHNYTTGLLHYYYLTGDPAARDAVLSLARWVIGMDDGTATVFAPADGGPTGLASSTREADYHGPGRGGGNSVNALLDGWLVTGERRYLDRAEALIRRCVHPLDDVAARDLPDVERRWSYTVFLAALARYLGLKAEAGALDFLYAYAHASLLRYAEWMLRHEVPYFDRPEQLEYPTETWAAQELRKANVLRLAAGCAEEPLRGRLTRRAAELSERGWHDLMRFDSRHATRPVALVLVEGLRDAFFRTCAAPSLPKPPGPFDFGRPQAFVPQRQRARARLKTAGGLARALARLADVRSWPRLLRALRAAF
jgi:hypothetical protein